jgi:hypothetical protein
MAFVVSCCGLLCRYLGVVFGQYMGRVADYPTNDVSY